MIGIRFPAVAGLCTVLLCTLASDGRVVGIPIYDPLRDEPITMVFRVTKEVVFADGPTKWEWSINSAGEGELTFGDLEPTHRKLHLSPKQMSAIRKTLCEERFVEFKEGYGPLYVHGGWSTLTVIAGEHVNKTVRFNSTASWANDAERTTLAKLAPAARVWLRVAENVDPEGNIIKDRKDLAIALERLTK